LRVVPPEFLPRPGNGERIDSFDGYQRQWRGQLEWNKVASLRRSVIVSTITVLGMSGLGVD
jgi:hypothetical protein